MRAAALAVFFSGACLAAQFCEGAAACKCNIAAGAIALAFPAFDPSIATDFTDVATTPNPAFSFSCVGPPAACAGGVFYALVATGLNDLGATHRMRHASQGLEYIPYTLTISSTPPPPAARGSTVMVTVSGSVFYNDYRSAYFGTYNDIVTITLTP